MPEMPQQQLVPPRWKTFVRNCLMGVLIVLILPIWVPLVLILFVFQRVLLYILIWSVWLPRGRDVLFVYSESPIWKEYMIEEILPLARERAVILNWSERTQWRRLSLAVQAFRAFGGDREFNPLVIVFRPFQFARKFRFWRAFKASKRGDQDPVAKLRQELIQVL